MYIMTNSRRMLNLNAKPLYKEVNNSRDDTMSTNVIQNVCRHCVLIKIKISHMLVGLLVSTCSKVSFNVFHHVLGT